MTEEMAHFINAEIGDLMFNKNKWFIINMECYTPERTWSGIWHQCDDYHAVYPVDYVEWGIRGRVKPSWKCDSCQKRAPKSVVAVFALLSPKDYNSEIAEGKDVARMYETMHEERMMY